MVTAERTVHDRVWLDGHQNGERVADRVVRLVTTATFGDGSVSMPTL